MPYPDMNGILEKAIAFLGSLDLRGLELVYVTLGTALPCILLAWVLHGCQKAVILSKLVSAVWNIFSLLTMAASLYKGAEMLVAPALNREAETTQERLVKLRVIGIRKPKAAGKAKRQEAAYKLAKAKEEALAAAACRKEAEAREKAYSLELHAQRILQNTREAFEREEEEREAARGAAAARLEEERAAEAERAKEAQLVKDAQTHLDIHDSVHALRTLESARRKLLREEIRTQVHMSLNKSQDMPQLLKALGFLPGNATPSASQVVRAYRKAMEQLNPANHASPLNSFREQCLTAEKYKFLSSFSKKQKTWEPPHHEPKSHEQARERTRAVLDPAGFSKGFKNPLFGQEAEDLLHSESKLPTTVQHSSSLDVCCNLHDANMPSSSELFSTKQTHSFGLLDTVMSGDALLSSADVYLPASFTAAGVQNGAPRSPEPRFGAARTLSPRPMSHSLSSAGFEDSAEDRNSRIDGPRHTKPAAGYRPRYEDEQYDCRALVDAASRSYGGESKEWFA